MRILYSSGNRLGANNQLQRFLEYLSPSHTVKVAAFVRGSHSFKNIDWTLDSLYQNILPPIKKRELVQIFKHNGLPSINKENAIIFLNEADRFEPDLIISDGDPVSAHIAKTLGVCLWYCSPLHVYDGIEWEKDQLRYCSLLEATRKMLIRTMPDPDRIFVYSPFGDISFRPTLRTGYEWLMPYHKNDNVQSAQEDNIFVLNDPDRTQILTKIVNALNHKVTVIDSDLVEDYSSLLKGCSKFVTTGETSYIADAFYQEKEICIIPSLKDPESLLNSILVKEYGIGIDLAQLELMGSFAVDELDKALEDRNNKKFLSRQNLQQLHQKVEEICTT